MPKSKTRRVVKALIILDVLVYNIALALVIRAADGHTAAVLPVMFLLTCAIAAAIYSFYWTDYPEREDQRKHGGTYSG